MLLLAPTALALGALTVYPGAWVLWLSLQHRIPIFGVARFAGLDNFTFLSVDARFWSAAHTTAVFTVASVALEVVLGVGAALAVLFRTFDALRAFDIMFVLTGGGPANTTETLTVYAYRALFQTLQLGFGSALSVVVFALVMVVAWAYLRLLRAGSVAA